MSNIERYSCRHLRPWLQTAGSVRNNIRAPRTGDGQSGIVWRSRLEDCQWTSTLALCTCARWSGYRRRTDSPQTTRMSTEDHSAASELVARSRAPVSLEVAPIYSVGGARTFVLAGDGDAWAGVRGFVNQVDPSPPRWFDLEPTDNIMFEHGGDIDVVAGFLTASPRDPRPLEQVNVREGPALLRTTARAAPVNLFKHRGASPSCSSPLGKPTRRSHWPCSIARPQATARAVTPNCAIAVEESQSSTSA